MNNNYNGSNNYQNPGYQPPTYQPPVYQPPTYNTGYYPQKPPYSAAAEDALSSMNTPLFLLVSILFGWLCSRSLLIGETGIGMTVLGIAFYVLFLPFILSKQNKKVPLSAWLLLIPQVLISISFSLYSGVGYTMLALLSSFVIAAFQTTLMAGCSAGKPFSVELLCDVCSTYLAYPFINMGKTFSAVFGSKKDKSQKRGMSVASKIGLGLLISVPVVLVLICLLASADEMFAMWVEKFIDALNISLGRIVCDVMLTAITMLYIMPLVVTLRSGYHKTYEKKPHNRPFDAIITTTVLFAASAVYLIFVAVQFSYLFVKANSLPDGLSYAEYCRRGFFELVFVIAVTTVVIALVCMLTVHNQKDKLPIYTKAALLLITACDVVMIISAARRVYIYVDVFDMTVSRLNAAVLIAFMGICLIVTAFKIVFEKLQVSAIIGGVAAVMLALYCLADIDGFVAKYNVDRYLSNRSSVEIVINYLGGELSPAAIPEIERLMENASDDKVKTRAKYAIAQIADTNYLFEGDNGHLGRWTLDRQRAVNIIEKHNITQETANFYYDNYYYDDYYPDDYYYDDDYYEDDEYYYDDDYYYEDEYVCAEF